MRVIAGRLKGRRLASVGGATIRPATDRARQVIFDVLSCRINLENSIVLDLFAGTGSLGIEALSRGAKAVTFVDSSGEAVACITRNLRAMDLEESARVTRANALAFVATSESDYNLIFCDPPYRYEQTAEICNSIFSANILRPGGYLLVEHARTLVLRENDRFRVALDKRFGSTVVTFITHRDV
jgi:16S rRNA (guanine966-N2)-methyltransferase